MKINHTLLYVFIGILTMFQFGCNSHPERGNNTDKFDQFDVIENLKVKRAFQISEIVGDVDIFFLRSNPEAIIGEPHKIIIGKKHILVICKQTWKAYLYDLNGSFIRMIGRQGKGPGEYLKPNNGFFDDHEENVFLVQYGELLKYSIQGEYIGKSNMSNDFPDQFMEGIYINEDEIIAFFDWSRKPVDQMFLIGKYSTNLILQEKMAYIDNQMESEAFKIPKRGFFYSTNKGIIWKGDTIYSVDKKFVIKPSLTLNITRNKPNPADLNSPFSMQKYRAANQVNNVVLVRNYLIMSSQIDETQYYQIYNVHNHEKFTISDISINNTSQVGLKDDLIGLSNIKIEDYNSMSKSFVRSMSILELEEIISISKNETTGKYPEKRSVLNELVNNNDDMGLVVINYR